MSTGMEVAVIGMAGRFPGARNLESFWRNLRDGVESISFFSPEELVAAGVSPVRATDPEFIPASPVLDDADLFAASFFGYSPREAELIDPQQRLFLECAWEAFEDAGYVPGAGAGLVGVYAGSWLSNYLLNNLHSNPGLGAITNFQVELANDKDYLATRVSYKLDLGGPSLNVETACSTALVASHLACQGLLAGECDMALAGAVHLQPLGKRGYSYRPGAHFSPDGHCRAFDARAAGTNFGSGLGAVVLKRLEDAVADGDAIRAVIKGSALTNDGASKAGFSAPGVDGQERAIRTAHMISGVDPETITFVEAHGTGTQLGDPLEVRALTRAFRAGTARRGFCVLGSVKTNIGHVGSAAGMAGLLKTVLALQHRQLPPSLHFEEPNPEIDFENSPFRVGTTLTPWEPAAGPRRAGVSSFGMGGTNAHLVVEEAPEAAPSGPSRPWQLLVLSAETSSALEAVTDRLAASLKADGSRDLADVAFVLKAGRRALAHRRTLVVRDAGEAIRALEVRDSRVLRGAVCRAEPPSVAFLFSGQGSQYPGMMAGLYGDEPAFRDCVDRCSRVLAPELGLDLGELLFADPERAAEAGELLGQTWLTQPALFVVELALARLWEEWGVRPEALLGHSIGEYVAACLAGVFTVDEALSLVAARGRLMHQGGDGPAGRMLAVPLPEEEILPRLGEKLALAAINGPERAVVSGPAEAVDELAVRLRSEGIACRDLATSNAFHSSLMDPVLGPFREVVAGIDLKPPRIPFLSNVTGDWIRASEATDPDYWVRHLRSTVRFADGVEELLREPRRILVEVGPGDALSSLARRHPARQPGQAVVASTRRPRDSRADGEHLLASLATLWMAGVEIDWRGFYARERRRRVPLPTYPFERQRYWIERDLRSSPPRRSAVRKKPKLSEWFYVPYWQPSALPDPPDLEEGGSWLLFLDGLGLGEELARGLRAAGQSVTCVRPGTGPARRHEDGWILRPAARDDYEALLSELAGSGDVPPKIVHLWSVTGGGPEPGEDPGRALELGFYSLLALAQALGRQGVPEGASLTVVSDGLRKVDGRESLWPEKAALCGPCQVIPREYPTLRCRSVDVRLAPGGTARLELVDRLIAEAGDSSPDLCVAYRGGARWRQSFQPVELGDVIDERLRLRRRGVYLITGGLGGLGLAFAGYLAEAFEARLVLVGRSSLPPREAWEEHLRAAGESGSRARKIRKLQALEKLGGEVLTLQADVSDREQMERAASRARERFGSLHGVVHAAGLPGGGVIQRKTPAEAAAVLAPKVRGTRVLLEVLAGEELDFFLSCSSTTALLSIFGQVDYCAANGVLDAWALAEADRSGTAMVSVNWGAWEEVGMAAEATLPERLQGPEGGGAAVATPKSEVAQGPPAGAAHRLLGRPLEGGEGALGFVRELRAEDDWVLAEHRILGRPAVPGTTYLEMARAALEARTGRPRAELRDVFFTTPLRVSEGGARQVRTLLEARDGGFEFRVMSAGTGEGRPAAPAPGGSWLEHVRGRVAELAEAAPRVADLERIAARCPEERENLAGELHRAGSDVEWGPRWQSLKRVRVGDREGLIEVELPGEFQADHEHYFSHPALLDVIASFSTYHTGELYLPLSYGRVRLRGRLQGRLVAHLRLGDETAETVSADLTIYDASGLELASIERFVQKRVGSASGQLRAVSPTSPAVSSPRPATGPLAHGGISPAEGLEAFGRILSRHRGPRIVVSCKDLPAQLEEQARRRAAGPEAAAPASEARPAHPRPDLTTAFVAPASDLEVRLAELWQELLGISEIGVDDNFYELGGDSILGIQMVARAKEKGLDFTPGQLFENLTIAELAGVMAGSEGAARSAEPEAPAEEAFGLDRAAVERLAAGQGPIEDVYPLTPLQQGFLFHIRREPTAGLYLEVVSQPVEHRLDEKAFAGALRQVVDRHPALRSAFFWEGLAEPVQVVFARARVGTVRLDWRHLDPESQRRELESFLREEGRREFDLGRAPLIRVAVIRLADERFQVVWTDHHLLLDGWSSFQVMREIFEIYGALRQGAAVSPAPARPFREYVAWLRRRDPSASEAFWRETLAGFARANRLVAGRGTKRQPEAGRRYPEQRDLTLPAEVTGALKALSKRHQVTLNSLVQAVWALLLSRLSASSDVVYGVTLSGRPPELEGVESTVGVFINTLPMRVEVDPALKLADYLRELQSRQTALLRHSHTPLAQVQAWSEVAAGEPLFASIFHFWNFPGVAEQAGGRRTRYVVKTHYPLLVRAIPGDRLELQLVFDRELLPEHKVEGISSDFETVFDALAERTDLRLATLLELLAERGSARRKSRAGQVAEIARAKLKGRRAGSTPAGAGRADGGSRR